MGKTKQRPHATKKGSKTYDRFVEQPGSMKNVKKAPGLKKVRQGK